MATSPVQQALFDDLIDHAALFPPARAPLGAAITEHRGLRHGPYRWMLGRFVCPAGRLDDLARETGTVDGERWRLAVVLDGAAGADDWGRAVETDMATVGRAVAEHGFEVDFVEVRLPEAAAAAAAERALAAAHVLPASCRLFVEVPPADDWRGRLLPVLTALTRGADRLGDRPRPGAKLRFGGEEPGSVPSVDDVAVFVTECVHRDLPFKATAGLHHPLRRTVEEGHASHGFLNLLAATTFASAAGLDAADLIGVIGEEDETAFRLEGDELRWRDVTVGAGAVSAIRSKHLLAFGSCSFSEPVDALRELGFLR